MRLRSPRLSIARLVGLLSLCVVLSPARAISVNTPGNSSLSSVDASEQGSRAALAGASLEHSVEEVVKGYGFTVVSYNDWEDEPEKYGKELLLTNAPFETIYGHPGRSEFVLKSEKYDLDIRIECKWQKSSGSVDEKFPYLLINCFEQMPEKNVFIIIDGGGAKPGAVEWIRKYSKKNRYRTSSHTETEVTVMDFAEFLDWANETLTSVN